MPCYSLLQIFIVSISFFLCKHVNKKYVEINLLWYSDLVFLVLEITYIATQSEFLCSLWDSVWMLAISPTKIFISVGKLYLMFTFFNQSINVNSISFSFFFLLLSTNSMYSHKQALLSVCSPLIYIYWRV